MTHETWRCDAEDGSRKKHYCHISSGSGSRSHDRTILFRQSRRNFCVPPAVDGATSLRERRAMKTVAAILTVAMLALASVSSADAKGCIKGAIVGGAAGHFAGHHGALGAAAGCLYGHHRANEQDKQQQQQTQGNPRDAQGKM
jgi:hypothetical protein